jgi:ankyrin repeat protein
MPARDLSTQLKIHKPCSANWDQMIGSSRVRFCEHCQLSVNDLSSLTPKRVRRLIAKSKGRLCVRYVSDRSGNPLLAQAAGKLKQINRRVSRIAAGMFTATLSLTNGAGHAETDAIPTSQQLFHRAASGNMSLSASLASTIKGKITDSRGAPISGAGITLFRNREIFLGGTTSDNAGEYSIEGLLPGRYWMTIQAHGYKSSGLMYELIAEADTEILNHVLVSETDDNDGTREVTTMGAIAIVSEPAEPLIAAALADDLQALEAVLTRENVNLRDRNLGSTALEYAVRQGNREMVQVLLAAGADVNSVDRQKQTVLMMLGEEATSDIVWDLVNAGAKLNLQDEDGDTALMAAAMEKNLPALLALLHAGAKVELKNDEGQTALMLAAEDSQLANVRALVRAGANLNAQDNDGWTPLDYAYSSDDEKIIKLFLSYGAITGKRKPK